jgi:hypothetical protein
LDVAGGSDFRFGVCELIEEIPCGVFEISFPRFSSVQNFTFHYLEIFLQKAIELSVKYVQKRKLRANFIKTGGQKE